MHGVLTWLETHENLSGWAQFLGTMLALAATYFTAFAPIWRRKRQLASAAARLLNHAYEALESYHRTSAFFLPMALSLRQAAQSMGVVADEISRFPVFELDDHGPHSIARRLLAVGAMLSAVQLVLDTKATELGDREATREERDLIREFVEGQLNLVVSILSGAKIKRPDWSDFQPA